jgi:hypothetical protein
MNDTALAGTVDMSAWDIWSSLYFSQISGICLICSSPQGKSFLHNKCATFLFRHMRQCVLWPNFKQTMSSILLAVWRNSLQPWVLSVEPNLRWNTGLLRWRWHWREFILQQGQRKAKWDIALMLPKEVCLLTAVFWWLFLQGCDAVPSMNQCDNGICYDSSLQCDGVEDCTDGSDERHCQGITKSWTYLNVLRLKKQLFQKGSAHRVPAVYMCPCTSEVWTEFGKDAIKYSRRPAPVISSVI